MFLGGPSLNKAVVAAFEDVLGRGLVVPKHREVLGAFGAAISLQEKMAAENIRESAFRGLESAIRDRMDFSEKICQADPHCHNQCKLKIYDFDGRRSVWGGECGRYEVIRGKGRKEQNFFKLREEIWNTYMLGVHEELGDEPMMEVEGRPTVGMQRALYTLQTGVLWAHFFDRLGFRVVLTPPTNSHLSSAGIEVMTAETCYPIKVSHGHVRELVGKTSILFLPAIVNMPTHDPSRCGLLLPPAPGQPVHGADGPGTGPDPGAESHPAHETGSPHPGPGTGRAGLRKARSEQDGDPARPGIRHGEAGPISRRRCCEKGREILDNHDPERPLVIVSGRPYNLYDERLNLRLGQNLAKIGMTALPMDFVDVSAVDLSDFPNMYWGLGAQILRTAKVHQGPSAHLRASSDQLQLRCGLLPGAFLQVHHGGQALSHPGTG